MPVKRRVPLANGEAWLVDKHWFDKYPPFIGFYELGAKDGWDVWSNVRVRLEDSHGFLWLSNESYKGLVRYDGHLFQPFTANPQDSTAMPTNQIEGVVEDKTGMLWIATRAGLVRYDPRTGLFKTFRNTHDPAGSVLNAIFMDTKDRLWVSTNGQVYEFDRTALRFVATPDFTITDYTQGKAAFKGQVEWLSRATIVVPDGSMWTAFRLPDNKITLANVWPDRQKVVCYPMLEAIEVGQTKPNSNYAPELAVIYPDSMNAGFWIGGWFGGLRYFDLRTKRWTQYVQQYDRVKDLVGADIDYVHNIHRKPDGKLWLNTAQFMTLFDPKTQQFSVWSDEKTPGTVDWKERKRLFWDKHGRIWAAYKTLSVHDPKAQVFQRLSNTVPAVRWTRGRHASTLKKTWLVYEKSKGSGDPVSTIACLDEKTGKFELDPLPAIPQVSGSITDICVLGQQLWVLGLNNVLLRVEMATGWTTPIYLPADTAGQKPVSFRMMRKIAPAADGGLWLSSSELKSQVPLLHFAPATGLFRQFKCNTKGGIPFARADYLFMDSKGRLWIASEGTEPKGIACLDPSNGQVAAYAAMPGDPHSLLNNYVKNMAEDRQGRIWMATRTGVCWFDEHLPVGQQFNAIPDFKGNVEHIAVDKNDNIWISGFAGVFLYRPKTGILRVFGPKNGMYLPELPMYQRSDGSICWGGVYRLHPDSLSVLTEAPKVYFTDFRIFEQPWKGSNQINFTDAVTLRHDDNFFTICWSAINFTNPEQDQYAYQLTDVDTGWIYCGLRNQSAYTKLPPGHYRFRLKAANRDGIWGAEKTLDIEIKPAWYQTAWFKILVAGLLLGMLYAFYRFRLNQAKLSSALAQKEAEMRQKEAEFQQKLSEAQMSALRAQMNPHFIFNSLNSINRFIQLSEPDEASNFLTKFSRLIRLILDNSSENLIPLYHELDACRLYLEMEAMRFAGQFEYNIQIGEGIDVEKIMVPPLLIQPYIENAIWHGLMQKEKGEKILYLGIHGDTNALKIVVADNGIGRERAKAIKSKSASRQKSKGMHLTQQRIDLLRQDTGVAMEIEVSDIKNDLGEVSGTKVEIFMQYPTKEHL